MVYKIKGDESLLKSTREEAPHITCLLASWLTNLGFHEKEQYTPLSKKIKGAM